MPALIAIVGLVVVVSWLKMHPKDQDKVIGSDQ